MSSSSSSDVVEDQIAMTLSCALEEAMSMLAAEAAGSSSASRLKRRRHYINHDREAAHLSLHHNYFDDDCVYPHHTSVKGTVCEKVFS
jgi:hypothetical protein